MKRLSCLAALGVLLTGCAGGKLKGLQAKLDLCELNSGELRKLAHEGEDKAAALQAQVKDLEGQGADLDGKFKAQQERIDSLNKSNQQLRSAIDSDKGELSGKIAEVVKEKDELARSLDAVKKDKIAAQRERANMRTARDRLSNELNFLRPQLEGARRGGGRGQGRQGEVHGGPQPAPVQGA